MPTVDEIINQEDLPAIMANAKGFIIKANHRFLKVFHWKQKDLIGKPLTVIIPKEFHVAHHAGFSRFITTEKPTLLNKPLKLKVCSGDGQICNAEHIICANQKKGSWVFAATISPLGESK